VSSTAPTTCLTGGDATFTGASRTKKERQSHGDGTATSSLTMENGYEESTVAYPQEQGTSCGIVVPTARVEP
jgi:hypothetical protein